jgi:hypothetical protein
MTTAEEGESAGNRPQSPHDSLGGAAVALGVLGLLPVPGGIASLLVPRSTLPATVPRTTSHPLAAESQALGSGQPRGRRTTEWMTPS